MKIHLYLPAEKFHDALCDRYKHIMNTVDHDSDEIEEKREDIEKKQEKKKEMITKERNQI